MGKENEKNQLLKSLTEMGFDRDQIASGLLVKAEDVIPLACIQNNLHAAYVAAGILLNPLSRVGYSPEEIREDDRKWTLIQLIHSSSPNHSESRREMRKNEGREYIPLELVFDGITIEELKKDIANPLYSYKYLSEKYNMEYGAFMYRITNLGLHIPKPRGRPSWETKKLQEEARYGDKENRVSVPVNRDRIAEIPEILD